MSIYNNLATFTEQTISRDGYSDCDILYVASFDGSVAGTYEQFLEAAEDIPATRGDFSKLPRDMVIKLTNGHWYQFENCDSSDYGYAWFEIIAPTAPQTTLGDLTFKETDSCGGMLGTEYFMVNV